MEIIFTIYKIVECSISILVTLTKQMKIKSLASYLFLNLLSVDYHNEM